MNRNLLDPFEDRARRIRDLQSEAHAQRVLLHLQMHELFEHTRPLELVRHGVSRLIQETGLVGSILKSGWIGLLLGKLLGRLNPFSSVRSVGPGIRFPWKAAAAAGVGMLQLRRWWHHRRQK